MRDILFRGKTNNGEWVYGDIRHDYDGVPSCISDYCGSSPIIPESVGQYTGKTDVSGEKIFEGDIVSGALRWLEQPKYGIVTFRDGSFGLLWYRGEAEQFNPFASMCNVWYEVVGNIFDNPELMEV